MLDRKRQGFLEDKTKALEMLDLLFFDANMPRLFLSLKHFTDALLFDFDKT